MITFLDTPTHVVACRVEGRIEGADYDALAARLNSTLEQHDRIGLCIEVVSPQGVTAEAVVKDASYGLRQIRHLNRFHHVALVTDVDWLRTLTRWENKVIPMVHVRAFPLAEREAALAWAAELPDLSRPGIVRLATSRDSALAYAVQGPFTADDVRRLVPELEAAFETHGQVDVLVRIASLPGVPWAALKGDLARTKMDALRHVRRYAVVGGPAWLSSAASLLDPLLRAEVRSFAADNEAAAWDWIGAQPAPEPMP